jgi:1-deoxyxylulose-5-phosphate synthase
MRYTKFGRTGMDVSVIALGCMSFSPHSPAGSASLGWALSEEESRDLIRQALDAGVNFFDTANSYGRSEEITGRALADMADRDEIVIATKVSRPMRPGPNGGGLSRKAIMSEIDASLRRLRTDYVDLYQIHRWDYDTPIEETLEAFDDLVKAGKVRYIGASAMWAWQFARALGISERHGWARFASMQNYYNLLYREEEREMLPLCAAEGIAVTPFSPLARGRLTRPWDASSERQRIDEELAREHGVSHFREEDEQIVTRTLEVADRLGRPPAQVALAWLLSKPVVTSPIVGVTKTKHLTDALAATELELDPEDITLLEEPYLPHPVNGHV